ncbi:MAG: GNAT family N-acetyltransferase [Acidimicrobiales bacterium]
MQNNGPPEPTSSRAEAAQTGLDQPAAAPDWWPLFGLRLVTARLVLRCPTDGDFPGLLDAIDAGIHEPAEMPFTFAWTDAPPAERRRQSVLHWWRQRANWSPGDWALGLAVFLDGQPIGSQALMAKDFSGLREVETGSWLTRSAQGQGLGKEMRAAVLNLAFGGLRAEVARSAAFDENIASVAVSRTLGYRENGHYRAAPRGTPVPATRFELTAAEWRARQEAMPWTRIVGLEPCLPMFGLGPG